jgi:hypothetical protein
MKRRSFVGTSILFAAAGTGLAKAAGSEAKPAKGSREFYELRVYTLKNDAQQKLVEAYFRDALMPALNRLSNQQVGVFTEFQPTGQTKLYTLMQYYSWDDFTSVGDKLAGDQAYLAAADGYLNAPASDPAYERIESSLLKAFAHMPKMQAPPQTPRIFELRRYEHATEGAGKKKLEMFNDAGEINIFKRLGFNPVFFGETIVGPARPNLTYMITFDDMAAHDSHWKAFVGDPEWKKISVMPEYSDAKLVSHITSTMLAPVAFSQI